MHIADVTHFIKPGTSLDDEAWNRGTTVYLTDKVNPVITTTTTTFFFFHYELLAESGRNAVRRLVLSILKLFQAVSKRICMRKLL